MEPSLSKIPSPKIVFKKCSSLHSLLVSSIFPPKKWNPLNKGRMISEIEPHTHNSFMLDTPFNFKSTRCGIPRCLTCPMIESTTTYTSTTTNKRHRLKQNLNCGSSNLIYLINCKRCNIQYVGETGQKLRERVNNHRWCIRSNIDTPVGIHFNSLNHSINDLRIIPIENLTDENKSGRLSREAYYQLILGTIFPQGLNQFPVQDRELYKNLNITTPSDLTNFVNLTELQNIE